MKVDISDLGPEARKQVLAQLSAGDRKTVEKSGKSKYNAQKTKRGNITFDSKREAERYDELLVMLRAGKISNLKLQPTFTLQESYITPEGERIQSIKYVADFYYEKTFVYPVWNDVEGKYDEHELIEKIVEDVKSKATRTPQYIMKRKMMQEKFGIPIQEV